MSKTMLVTVTKVAEVEVEVEDARRHLLERGEDLTGCTDEEIAEIYMSFAEGVDIDLCFDRFISAVSPLEEIFP